MWRSGFWLEEAEGGMAIHLEVDSQVGAKSQGPDWHLLGRTQL